MFRILLLALAALLSCSLAWAEIPKNVVITVIAADKEQTYALSESVREVRDRYGITLAQLPITRIPSQKLTPQDYKRIGFTASSLPVIALMKVSSSNNLEGVLGDPPYIFRNVKQATLAAQILVCRWSEMSGREVPPDLVNLSNIYQPHRIFVLNTGDTLKQVEATAAQLEQVKGAAGVSDTELPVLSTTYHDGLLGEEEYTRLGFVSDAFPIVCLVQMSESANPSKIVGEGILRWSYNAAWSARQIVRLWARLVNRSLASLPPDGDQFTALGLGWVGGSAHLSAGRAARYQCSLVNFRYGVGGRVWLQSEGRVVTEQGSLVAPLPVVNYRREHSDTTSPMDYPIEAEILAPASPGKYRLELEFRDKLGGSRTDFQLPFEI